MDVDKWIEVAKDCKYLPENDLKVGIKSENYECFTYLVWYGNNCGLSCKKSHDILIRPELYLEAHSLSRAETGPARVLTLSRPHVIYPSYYSRL